MIKRTLPAIAVTAAVTAAAACSSSSSPAVTPTAVTPPPSATATAVNPVTILKQTGATVPAGTVVGEQDLEGDRYASGTYPGGESVTVYTMATQQAFLAEQDRLSPDDSHGEVTVPGKLAVISTTGVLTADGAPQWGGPTPAQIAAKVGGLVTAAQQ